MVDAKDAFIFCITYKICKLVRLINTNDKERVGRKTDGGTNKGISSS